MKKLARIIYFLVMAMMILSLSGCGSDDDDNNSSSRSKSSNLMVISSPILQLGETYRLYRGSDVAVQSTNGYNPTYYAAPIDAGDTVYMNLEFADSLGGEQPFLIQDSSGNVVFFYNPNGNGSMDTTTAYGEVKKVSGGSQLSYNGLNISASSVKTSALSSVLEDFDTDEVVIQLNGDTATMDGSPVFDFRYVWHADPDHADEYYTHSALDEVYGRRRHHGRTDNAL